MRILLTNDDGIHAPGLHALAKLASEFGEVVVVAPDTERSGVSHAITLFRPLRLREVQPGWHVCDGTPTDCVYLALNQLHLDPDLVLSGINPGPNLGHDVLYSGTVAGALEAAHWGVPALAISHCASGEDRLHQLIDPLRTHFQRLVDAARDYRGVLNVNLPDIARLPWNGLRATRMGHRYYSNEVVSRDDPRGRAYFWIGGAHVHMPDIEGSDCNAVRDGYVSVTPLGDDLTRHAAVADLSLRLQ